MASHIHNCQGLEKAHGNQYRIIWDAIDGWCYHIIYNGKNLSLPMNINSCPHCSKALPYYPTVDLSPKACYHLCYQLHFWNKDKKEKMVYYWTGNTWNL